MRLAAILVAVLALTACGAHKAASPSEVVRAWSKALNSNDNAAAAKLFADGATIIQDGVLTLHTQSEAREWNAGLPCGGHIASVEQQGPDRVLVVFDLADRPSHHCEGPGTQDAAIFQVDHGKIVLWHETPVPAGPPAV